MMAEEQSMDETPETKAVLYEHRRHGHIPENVNVLHETEKVAAGFNKRLAIVLTQAVGTMVCAYVFTVLAIIGFPGFHATPQAYVQWISQTFIQLVMLSVIMVGQSLLGRKQELQADEQFNTTRKIYADIEEVARHQEAHDEALLKLLNNTTTTQPEQQGYITDLAIIEAVKAKMAEQYFDKDILSYVEAVVSHAFTTGKPLDIGAMAAECLYVAEAGKKP